MSLTLAVSAENFSIKLKGEELKKISALEIELDLEPNKVFVIDEELIIQNLDDLLFKTVDQNNSLIRVFLAKPLENDELLLEGSLSRVNYSGKVEAKIASVTLIPDFAQEVDSSKIQTKLTLSPSEEALPFMGISKAEILGPRERVFSENMFVSISNIETYGFTLAKSIRKPRINGQEAKFLTDEIIAVNLQLDPQTTGESLDIVLELDVDGKTISKTVDRISFVSY